jgi:hypothetical protein
MLAGVRTCLTKLSILSLTSTPSPPPVTVAATFTTTSPPLRHRHLLPLATVAFAAFTLAATAFASSTFTTAAVHRWRPHRAHAEDRPEAALQASHNGTVMLFDDCSRKWFAVSAHSWTRSNKPAESRSLRLSRDPALPRKTFFGC